MKEEIARIMRLVKEGKLSPEDAAELIDAFTANESAQEAAAEPPPPPPPGEGPPPPPPGSYKDPFQSFVDTMENLGREVTKNVNWHEVAKQIREGTKKGVEGVKEGIEQIRQGKSWGWFSAYENREVTLPLPNVGARTLRIENPCGDVKIVGGFEEGSVAARARVRGSDADDAHLKANDYTVIVEESDHEVLIRQPDVSGLEVDVVVQIKDALHVDVKTSAGDIQVFDTGGGCRASNQSGDISLRGLTGAMEVTTQNGDLNVNECNTPTLSIENKTGDINITDFKGNLNARSASGDLNVRKAAGKTISVESVNGDVNVDLIEPITGTVNIRTVNGDANVEITDGCDCRVSLSTLRGDVNCSVPLEDEARMEQRITGRLGQGTGTLDVSGVNGDVHLRMRDAAS